MGAVRYAPASSCVKTGSSLVLDETGAVIAARVMDGFAPQSLRDAAAEVAYKASFKTVVVDGRAVVAKGILDYRFALPK